MLEDFLNGKIVLYVKKETFEDCTQIARFCNLIKPYITTWPFNDMTLYEYVSSCLSGKYFFIKHPRCLDWESEKYVRMNNLGRILTLDNFLALIMDEQNPNKDVPNDEHESVLFG